MRDRFQPKAGFLEPRPQRNDPGLDGLTLVNVSLKPSPHAAPGLPVVLVRHKDDRRDC